ncbi:response regulator [Leucobacter soli]|uniref:Transcriptional regulatory protein LiaR n=1 Tax=Leucobacter soli TaxID=2812850 RepID=A0A916JXK4_9MICO|nr:response regulator transcription factor [Leucobacter soli]CAG7613438.1 Transcriptional regulatory protein LiaR [Leucobacter soli]
MIRVLLVDDQELVRSGFRVILESEPDIEVVGEAANGEEAVRAASELAPTVVCMDVEMPVLDGIEASRRILADARSLATGAGAASDAASGAAPEAPAPAILILTTFGHETYLFDALAAGVSGFLLKTSRAEQLIEAVRSLAAGQALLGPDVTRAVLDRIAGADGTAGAALQPVTNPGDDDGTTGPGGRDAAFARAGLTEREREVLSLLAEGRSNAEIAGELFLGDATVKTHVSNILQKLGVRDRIQAVVWAHTHAIG